MINLTSQNEIIEQLWYTWSDVGIDTIRAGFRIRAASPGLLELDSERLQRLDSYQRYFLPKGADRAILPNIAPISLVFINTGKERILVHKAYTGRDGVGRYGAFFIHLLANLPEEFTVIDAILLWHSPFWQRSDITLKDRKHTRLARTSLDNLRQQQIRRARDPQSSVKIGPSLLYVIQAYLTVNLRREQARTLQPRQKLYIAASDDMVAQLISGLLHSLPAQLVKDLTFSTYEHDVTNATTEIVGTCWLSVPEPEKDPVVAQLLPAHYYHEKLVFNCYTGVYSPLEPHPLAALCAQSAVEYVLTGTPEYQDLLDTVTPENYPDLTIDTFLQFFEMIVVRAQAPSQSDIEAALMPQNASEYAISAKLLLRANYKNTLLSLVLNVPGWWANYKERVITLRQQSVQVPMLAKALSMLAQLALPIVVDIAKRDIALLLIDTPLREVSAGNEATFKRMVDVMDCAAPPKAEPDVWRTLLKKLLKIPHIFDFFQHHWSIYTDLMDICSSALSPSEENNKLISSLLTIISWDNFGEFLALHLPIDWNEMVAQKLVFQSSKPDAKQISSLEQQYYADIKELLRHLADSPQRWPTATALFDSLIIDTYQYQEKMSLLSLLLDSPMGKQASIVESLLRIARLSIQEKASFLQYYGQRYLSLYPQLPLLLDYVQDFLDSLKDINIAIFRSSPSPDEPSVTENFLLFLSHFSLPHPTHELAYNWYAVARFVRQPSLLRKKWERIAPAISCIVNMPGLSPDTHASLLQEQAVACIAIEQEIPLLLGNINTVVTKENMKDLLYKIAESAREGVSQRRYTKTLFLPCIYYILSFTLASIPETFQDTFVEQLLGNTLLPNIDERTVNWIKTQTKRWPPDIAAAWQRFVSRRQPTNPSVPFPALSLPERIEISWERTIALRQMQRALKDKRMVMILQVGTDYITTLNDYLNEVPHEYWLRLDEALDTVYEAQQHPQTLDFAKHKPLPFAGIRSLWRCIIAFTQVWLALGSGKIGRIVRVATEHMITLDRYAQAVPSTWWRQIDIAFDIFIALEVNSVGTEEDRICAIVAASQKLDLLVYAKHPAPWLTMHEWRHIKAVVQYMANRDAQKMGDEYRQQALSTLQELLVNQQTTNLPPSDIMSATRSNRGIQGWFVRRVKRR